MSSKSSGPAAGAPSHRHPSEPPGPAASEADHPARALPEAAGPAMGRPEPDSPVARAPETETGTETGTESETGTGTGTGSPAAGRPARGRPETRRSGPARLWPLALRRTPVSLWNDDISDWAAALTYYAILALLPALLVTVSVIGLANPDATGALIADITAFAPAESAAALRQPLEAATQQRTAVWLLVGTGAVSALWSASSYLAVFRRAQHAMHGVKDNRPALRKAHIIVASAIGLLLLMMTSAFALVLTGPLARWLGHRLGLAHVGDAVWAVLKWPLLLCLVAALITVLFRTGPEPARGARRALPGGVLAALLWLVASAGFALYATYIGSYSRLYGSLAGLVVFLVWVWLTNLALLAGAQFNVELNRARRDAA